MRIKQPKRELLLACPRHSLAAIRERRRGGGGDFARSCFCPIYIFRVSVNNYILYKDVVEREGKSGRGGGKKEQGELGGKRGKEGEGKEKWSRL